MKYFLTDQLGSIVAVVNASGGLVSKQRYYPFGQARTDAGSIAQTDYGFTGQRNLDAQGNSFNLGMMDYKARFYDVYNNHFIQPDSITAGGPQGLNRYGYVLNNPINATDPTGHRACEEVSEDGKCTEYSNTIGVLINFGAEEGQGWSKDEMDSLNDQYEAVARKTAREIRRSGFFVSPTDAFYMEFGGPTTILKKNTTCAQNHNNDSSYSCGAENVGNNTEWVYSNATLYALTGTHLLVHELGHNFFIHHPTNVPDSLLRPLNGNEISHFDLTTRITFGYLDQEWQNGFSGDNRAGEELADMFIGWVYGKWEDSQLGRYRNQFMIDTMSNIFP